MCSPLVSRKGNQEHVPTGVRFVLLDQTPGQLGLVETTVELRFQEGPSLDRTWSQGRVPKGSSLCAETLGAEFVDPSDVDFAIQDLLKDRRIGVYQDLAPGGEHFLSRSRATSHTTPGKGKQRIVDVLCSLNEATVKCQTTYEDLRMLKSVVRSQDFMLRLDVESEYFHVPIHPQHRKFFSSHLVLLLFVNNKFIEIQSGGYFVCTRPDLAPSVPSAQTPLHLRHIYHQVVEFSHEVLSLGWTRSSLELGQVSCRS
jgi:hypothetical protein